MSIKYQFKGIDVSNIVGGGNVNPGGNYYTGFPTSSPAEYQIDRPLALLYSIQGVDISNNCSVNTITYDYSANITSYTANIPTGAKYISAICVGGGGGGGGGGGAGWKGAEKTKGGDGGTGGAGSYCSIIQYAQGSNTYNVVVGQGGAGGNGGSERSTNGGSGPGSDGVPGSSGGYSSLTIDEATIDASGGTGGGGGGSGNENTGGGLGGPGETLDGVIDPSNISVVGETTKYIDSYPPQTGGVGGDGGSGGPDSGSVGGPGTPGYVRVNFLYD